MFLLLLIVVNVLIIANTYYNYQPLAISLINQQFEQMKIISTQKPVKLDVGNFPVTEERLKEYGIHYVLVNNLTNNNSYPVNGVFSIAKFSVQ